MKKYLYASTVLASLAVMGGGFAVQAAELSITGDSKFTYRTWSDDAEAENGMNSNKMTNESHVVIEAESTADNGLTYGTYFRIESETGNGGGSNLKEDGHRLYVSGDFGKFILGGGSVGDTFYSDVLDRSIGEDGTSSANDGLVDYQTALAGDEVLSYHTPDFSGIKGGISFFDAGDASEANGLEYGFQYSTDLMGGALTFRYAAASKDADGKDAVAPADAKILANAEHGTDTAGTEVADFVPAVAEVKPADEVSATSLGVDFALGDIGFSIAMNTKEDTPEEGDAVETESTGLAVTYQVSEAMKLALASVSAEKGDDDELSLMSFSADYTLAKGLSTGLGYTTWDDAVKDKEDQSGTYTALYMKVAF